jgi:acyl-CoA thioesterase YciA
MAGDLGIHSNLFGGTMLSWIDEAGAALASQIVCTPRVVTVKMSEVVFSRPVKAGNLIKIYGQVKDVGNTSLTLALVAKKESPYTQEQKEVCSTDITFVRIDGEGDPVPISERVKKKYSTA